MRQKRDRPAATASDGEILQLFERLALEAGRAVMSIYHAGPAFEWKADASPVTEADRAAERIILGGLRAGLCGVACVAEEEVAGGAAPVLGEDDGVFLLVDPLDGTREFIAGNTDFTVNIALVRNGSPELGVVYAPALDLLYSGRPGLAEEASVRDHRVTARRKVAARQPGPRLTILASRSHRDPETDAWLDRYSDAEIVTVGSSLKFCMLAAGRADLYPRFGRTMEWDTAAGDAVLRAAGGMTRLADGAPLTYGKRGPAGVPDFANPPFVAEGAGP